MLDWPASAEARMWLHMRSDDLERAIEQSHVALGEIVRGNSEAFQVLFSQREDVTLGNPFGPFVRGWQQVAETAAGAASRYRDGETSASSPSHGTSRMTSPASWKWSTSGPRSVTATTSPRSGFGSPASSGSKTAHGSSCTATRTQSPPLSRRNPSSRSRRRTLSQRRGVHPCVGDQIR